MGKEYDIFLGFDAETGEPMQIAKEKGSPVGRETGKQLKEHMDNVRIRKEIEEIKKAQHDSIVKKFRRR